MNTNEKALEINSPEWWECYFSEGRWEKYEGEKQTLFFALVFLQNCPSGILEEIKTNDYTICDVGCAMGEATKALYDLFGGRVEGIDFSVWAIQMASQRFQEVKFTCCNLEEIETRYDVVFCSNVLEHLERPYQKLEKLCDISERYLVVLVPFEDDSQELSHINRFDMTFFDRHLQNFNIIFKQIIDTSYLENTLWNGKQALVIYEKQGLRLGVGNKDMRNDKLVPSVDTWDKVAETYQLEIEKREYQLADEIEKLLISLGFSSDTSLIEIGCGSGHLSACLAMKGYTTALMDFSEVALNKSKATYEKYNLQGEFIQGDLMSDTQPNMRYDVAWNSGVMEHFGDVELCKALFNVVKYASKGVLFLVPNSESVSYSLMRARLMSTDEWDYGTEYLRNDYNVMLERLGLSEIKKLHISTSEMCAHHMFLAAQQKGNIDALYKMLMDSKLLPENESYLVAYSALIEESRKENVPSEYAGITESITKIFDLSSRNFGLIEENLDLKRQLIECKAVNDKTEKKLEILDKQNEELNELFKEAKLKNKTIEEEKRVITAMNKEFEVEKTLFAEKLLELNQLRNKNAVIPVAEQLCLTMSESSLFKLMHFLYRFKYQGIKGNREERKNFRRWLLSKVKGSGGDCDRRYNPLFAIVNILRQSGIKAEGDLFANNDSPLAIHLNSEKKRLEGSGDLSEIRNIKKVLRDKVYNGILVYPHVVYWEPMQTPQQLLKAFAKEGWLCFFCEHPNRKDIFREAEENLFIVHEKELIQGISDQEITILITWMGSLSFVEKIKNKKIWYHVLDKLDIFPYCDDLYLKIHGQYVLKAEAVSYVATPLIQCLGERKDSFYLPNAVNPEEFMNVHDDFVPDDLKEIVESGRKIIGYYGYLAEWMDYNMVREAALARPDYEFVFVGKCICDVQKIEGLENVHLLGLKPYKELSDYAKFFDVGVIPFVINEKMDCVSPIKFYEYCALGLPVISSRMKEMENFVCEYVACVNDCTEYLCYLDKFVQDSIKAVAAKKAPLIAMGNTWQARAEAVQDVFDTELSKILKSNYEKYDVIILSVIDYDFRYQRPQHFASRFANNGHRVFYVNANHFNQSSIVRADENLYIVNMHNDKFISIHLTDWESQSEHMHAEFDVFLNRYCIRDAIVIVDYPNWIRGAQYLRKNYGFKIITDYMDDFTGFLNPAEKLVKKNCELLLKTSDMVIASSQFLFDIAKKYNENIDIVRNGTEYKHFHEAHKSVNNARKIIGYYGAVAEWFDFDKVIYIAQNLPECDVVIVGQVTKGRKKLSQYPNIKLMGEIPYNELPDYLETFNLCLIPFDTSTDLIKATNPVKFYEYLSAGKKIVATEIPELEPFKDKYVYMANDNALFLDYIKLCLEDRDQLVSEEERMKFGLENDWQVRYEKFVELCQIAIPLVSIVVLTYNNLEINKLCIDSIFSKTAYPNYELVIVDNKSTDGTREYLYSLDQEGRENVRILFNEDNMGFAGGNNIGIKASNGDYVVLLNNDTIVTRGWLTAMAKHLENNKQMGMSGPVTNSIGNEAKIEVTYRNKNDLDVFAYKYTTEHLNEEYSNVTVLALFCTMIKRKVIDSCGLLDESYEVGMFEDDDYAETVKEHGYSIAIVEDAFVHHFEGVSFKKLENDTFRKIYEQNKEKYEKKWKKRWVLHKKRKGVTHETNMDVKII